MIRKAYTLFVLAFLSVVQPLSADEKAEPTNNSKKELLSSSPFDVVQKEHTITKDGTQHNYESLTGTATLKGDDGKDKASIFFTAYFLKEQKPTNRPLTFCFNGGPGSSSIWLHMGALGPKKVHIEDLVSNQVPGSFEDNPYSLLFKTDLVFVDPVSTGFSRPADGVDPKQFYGVEEDISSIAEFIHLFVSQYDKWGAPKFLLGESYGTLRVAGLAEKLYEDYFMSTNGLVLISSCLDLASFDPSNDLSYILTLPSLTAASWYHQKLCPELQNKKIDPLLDEVEQFAVTEYAQALLLGDSLDPVKRKALIEKIAFYTGLSKEYVSLSNIRIHHTRFFKELLRAENKVIGRFDTRYKGFDLDSTADSASYDPSFDAIAAPFTSAFLQYCSSDLGWKKNSVYRVLTNSVHPWNWSLKNQPAGFSYLSLADHLKSAMIKNEHLHVFIASGFFDLATPYFATDYTADHLQLSEKLKKNVHQSYYEAGHMMYIHPPSLIKLSDDLAAFIDETLQKK